MASWKQRSQIFRTMPRRSVATFAAAVALLFAAFGAVQDALNVDQGKQPRLLFSILLSAVSAVLWGIFGSRRMIKSLVALAAVQTLFAIFVSKAWPLRPGVFTLDQLRGELLKHDVLILVFILTGYILMIEFVRMEGKRSFAAYTEIRLASEIQKELVPPISMQAAGFEFYGLSVPSGSVGGDLFDIVTNGDSFCAYVADVAGHGVPAGVLMSMVKSAVRMRTASAGPNDDDLLPTLNRVLEPLTGPETYATFAYITGNVRPSVKFSLAGHPPVFHYRHAARQVERCSLENLPLGMFPDTKYDTATIDCNPGDLLAIVTDGLTEVFDKKDHELGSEYISEALAQSAAQPLAEIASRIMRVSEAFGAITDDRTLLLARRIQ